MIIDIIQTEEFKDWLDSLDSKEQSLVVLRLMRISKHGHFGDTKFIDSNLAELRWKNGIRVYFTKLSNTKLIILLGGKKNAQKKDIKKARILIERYVSY